MERIDISKFKLVKDELDIPGSFTSVKGEYYIPEVNNTGFFKINNVIDDAHNDEDYRELVASKFMQRVGYPCADILLAKSGNNMGCLSVNILKENETFIDPDYECKYTKPQYSINEYIKNDLKLISSLEGISSDDLAKRKEYVTKYIFMSAVISNTDVKMLNSFMIRNSKTGQYRNPEYFDMGVAFIDSPNRNFFYTYSSKEIIEQLYDQYPSQIVPLGRSIQQEFEENGIDEFLSEEQFNRNG